MSGQVRALLRAGDLAGLAAGDELTRMRRQVASPVPAMWLCNLPVVAADLMWQVTLAQAGS